VLYITLFISYSITKLADSKIDLQTHSRSQAIMPFDSTYTISYLSSIVTMSLFCIVSEILLLISVKSKISCDHNYTHSKDSL